MLAQDPDHHEANVLMAIAAARSGDHNRAEEAARRAVELDPHDARSFMALGIALQDRRSRWAEAEQSYRSAIELEPEMAYYHGLLAMMLGKRKAWKEMREVAEQGLALDPEEDLCVNARAFALTSVGESRAAADTLEGHLQHDPEDPNTHANLGWSQLRSGEYAAARESFREALRLAPDHAWARDGLQEALRANHWFYRPVLRFFLWIRSFSARTQMLILVGGWLGYRTVFALTPESGPLRYVFWVAIGLYIAFALLTWFGQSVATTLMCFSADGRLVFDRGHRWESLLVTVLVAAGGALLGYGLWADALRILILGIGFLAIGPPLQLAFHFEEPRPRRNMLGYAAVVTAMAVALVAWRWDSAARRDRIMPDIDWGVAFEKRAEEHNARAKAIGVKNPDELPNDLRSDLNRLRADEPRYQQLVDEIENAKAPAGFEALLLALLVASVWLSQLAAVWIARREAG